MPTHPLRSVALSVLAVLFLSACGPAGLSGAASKPDRESTVTVQPLASEAQLTASTVSPSVVSKSTATVAPPQIPSDTPTPGVPQLHILHETSCLAGPDSTYQAVYRLAPGTILEIIGRSTHPDYVLVNGPESNGQTCWIWLTEAEVGGDLSQLPLSTPGPTPAPSIEFSASYVSLQDCGGWTPEFQIVNTGNRTLKSVIVTAVDEVTGTSVTSAFAGYDRRSGCFPPEERIWVDPGGTAYTQAVAFTYDPSGHTMHATLQVCAVIQRAVYCAEHSLDFTP